MNRKLLAFLLGTLLILFFSALVFLVTKEKRPETPTTRSVPRLTPDQARLLRTLYMAQEQFKAQKVIVDRELFLYGDSPKSTGIDVGKVIFGDSVTADTRSRMIVDLIEGMPAEYLRLYPETRFDNPFVIAVTEVGKNEASRKEE